MQSEAFRSEKRKRNMENTYHCYANRELSWLRFNERVLEEAEDSRLPLCERLSFLSIFQSNLDEFFMVRIGSLQAQMRSELRTLITKLGITGVFVTHDQIEAMSMSDAIAVCHAGKIEQYDTPEKIYSHPATEFVARFVGSSNWLDQNHLFRPEQAQTVPTEQAEKYDADVTAVQFLGSSYQLQLNHNGQDWTYISPRRVSVGEKISLYLPRSAIVAV